MYPEQYEYMTELKHTLDSDVTYHALISTGSRDFGDAYGDRQDSVLAVTDPLLHQNEETAFQAGLLHAHDSRDGEDTR